MKKFSDLVKEIHRPPQRTEAELREAYVTGEVFNVGEQVKTKAGIIAEIINRGPNYVTLLSEGKTFKSWISEIAQLSELDKKTLVSYMDKHIHNSELPADDPERRSPRRTAKSDKAFKKAFSRVYTGLSFKGYKVKNLTEEQFTFFTPILEHEDQYAVLNLVQCLDELAAGMEDFNRYSISYNRAAKYIKKFGLSEDVLEDICEQLFEHALLTDSKFISEDAVEKSAKILNGIYQQNKSPIEIIAYAAEQLRLNQGLVESEGWSTLGSFARMMKNNGLDLSTIHPKIKTLMGVE